MANQIVYDPLGNVVGTYDSATQSVSSITQLPTAAALSPTQQDPEKGDQEQKSIDLGRFAFSTDPKAWGVIPAHKYGSNTGVPEAPKFNEMPFNAFQSGDSTAKKAADASKVGQARKKPTTASAEPDQTLPQAVMAKDPNGQSQVFANMMKSLMTVMMLLSLLGGSSGKKSSISEPTGKLMADTLSSALSILSKRYTAEKVLLAFDNGFGVFGLDRVIAEYRDMVHAALANLVQNIIVYGEKNVPTPIVPTFTYGTNVPMPLYTSPLDMYVKQYEPQEEKDFPGYILWVGPTGSNPARIWTKRLPTEAPYKSADEEIATTTAYEIADALDPYIKAGSVTPEIINDILTHHNTAIQNKAMDLGIGHNSSSNLLANLPAILGLAGTILQLAQTIKLPFTVLNIGSMSLSMAQFMRSMAILKVMQSMSMGAFGGLGALGSLAGLSSLVGGFISGGLAAPLSALTGNGIGSMISSAFGGGSIASAVGSAVQTAAGAALTVASVSNAMKYSGASAATIVAASSVVKNLGMAN